METQKINAVNSLIIINNDRSEGYMKAAEEAKDSELKSLFTKFSQQSKTFSNELRKFVPDSEEPKSGETKNTGKLFRLWMDIKSAVTSNDRKAILSSCEFGEDAAKKEYKDALEKSRDLPADALAVITKQNSEILKSHNLIKSMRDAA
ncbi:MAG: PA2169 family four-helix-bundle protein [Bacteroidota bacterium]